LGASGHRLLAVLLTFAVTLLLRPSGVFAAHGPVAVHSVESSDVALHTPRRAVTSLDNDLRGFVGASTGEIVETLWTPAACIDVLLLRTTATDRVRSRALCRLHPRGPPHE
jgi:hypothetical protein